MLVHKRKKKYVVANALNDTNNVLNSSVLTNESNQTSNVIVSKNKVKSTMRSNSSGTADSSSIIKDKVTTKNAVCNSEKICGTGNDILYSFGNCNDLLTGGPSADKFTCGEGNDTIKDYNPEEGDVILDQANCETVL
jgi:hypothetical protein